MRQSIKSIKNGDSLASFNNQIMKQMYKNLDNKIEPESQG